MKKVTKKELLRRIEALEEWSNGADEMLTELNHALPDPEYDAKCEENAVAVEESLARHAVRLGIDKPKLKQLDQSVFDGLDAKWRFAAVDRCGEVWACTAKTKASDGVHLPTNNQDTLLIGDCYDTTDWQNSLIERDKVELTGSDLARAMLARGDKYVTCYISQTSEKSAKDVLGIVIGYDHAGFRVVRNNSWSHAVPINNQGEPLTQSEAGL